MKRVFNSMMFATAPLKKFPKGSKGLSSAGGDTIQDNDPFPTKTKIEEVTAAIMAKHPALINFVPTLALDIR